MKPFIRILFMFWMSSALGAAPASPRTLLLISMDGFRWDYLNKAETPHLHQLAKSGVIAKGLKSIFPSVTFPNHYSIVTGLYAEHHGIVSNEMFDPKTNRYFKIGDPKEVDASDWWEGEPLWVTAQKQGLLSGTMFWVGSTAEIKGIRPTYWQTYDAKVSKSDRIAKVLGWLDIPLEKRPRFLTLYFDDADSIGHKFGPDSPEEVKAIEGLDAAMGELLLGLKSRGLQDSIDIIVVSDHGMTTIEPSHTISFSSYLDPLDVTIIGNGAFASLWPKPGKEQKVFSALAKVKGHFQAYRKKDIPKRYHYQDHRRIAPILVVADDGWYLLNFGNNRKLPHRIGGHGYDNDLPNMQGTFIASGPSFRSGLTVGPLQNVDLYELMCHILGIKPAPNDGDFSRVKGLLKDGNP